MDEKRTHVIPSSAEEPSDGESLDVEWGENHQERILDDTERIKSERHDCKGRQCETAFDKL